MRTLILNVGLETGAKYGKVVAFSEDYALESLDASLRYFGAGSLRLAHKVAESNTEPTLVVSLELYGEDSGEKVEALLTGLSKNLKQEAIAYYVVEEQKGYLVGEYADSWGGEFNPEYFLI